MGEAFHDWRTRRPDAPLDAVSVEQLGRAARGAEELCAALWSTLREELRASAASGARVAELAERLAQVCSAVAALGAHASVVAAGPASATDAPGAAAPFPQPPSPPAEIAVHDTRGEGPSAWVQAIGASLQRYTHEALPFAVLLVEVLDVARLAQSETPAELIGVLGSVERELRRQLRPEDGITLESRGRWWLTIPQADVRGARALAERLAGEVRAGAAHRGAPLEVACGIATCPEDGRDAATLAAHADVGLYAARAAGQPLPPGEGA